MMFKFVVLSLCAVPALTIDPIPAIQKTIDIGKKTITAIQKMPEKTLPNWSPEKRNMAFGGVGTLASIAGYLLQFQIDFWCEDLFEDGMYLSTECMKLRDDAEFINKTLTAELSRTDIVVDVCGVLAGVLKKTRKLKEDALVYVDGIRKKIAGITATKKWRIGAATLSGGGGLLTASGSISALGGAASTFAATALPVVGFAVGVGFALGGAYKGYQGSVEKDEAHLRVLRDARDKCYQTIQTIAKKYIIVFETERDGRKCKGV